MANAMLALVENEGNRYPSGSVLEVTEPDQSLWRHVPLYNNPGPQGRAISVSNKDTGLRQIAEILQKDAGMANKL